MVKHEFLCFFVKLFLFFSVSGISEIPHTELERPPVNIFQISLS